MKSEYEIAIELNTKAMEYDENFRIKNKRRRFPIKGKKPKKENISKKETDLPKAVSKRFAIKPNKFFLKETDTFENIEYDFDEDFEDNYSCHCDNTIYDTDSDYFFSEDEW